MPPALDPEDPAFQNPHWQCGFCRCAVPRTTWRSSFNSGHCVCRGDGDVRATSPGPRRSSFTGSLREFTLLRNSMRLSFSGPVSSELSASSGSVVALCFAIPRGRAFPACIATTLMPALFLPFALDPKGPASSEDPATSDSVVALCFAIPGGRASPAGLAAAVTPALGVLFALGHDGPAPPEDTATLDSVAAMCFSNSGGRPLPSPTDSATVGTTTGTAIVALYFTSSRHIPNLLGGQLSHSFTRDQRHRLVCLPLTPTFTIRVSGGAFHPVRNNFGFQRLLFHFWFQPPPVLQQETRSGCAVPGMAVATQQWPPAALTELTWLHRCKLGTKT